jgi:MFS family permease
MRRFQVRIPTKEMIAKRPPWILPTIVFSQFTGTSLWFAGNAILTDLQKAWGIGPGAVGLMTSSVQLGFITGTLFFAYFAISDRFSPRYIFMICSVLGGVANAGIYFVGNGFLSLLAFRYITGFFIAGIYPVGMKIAAGRYKGTLGMALGFLVGALVVGTAFPHLIKYMGSSLD